MLNSGVFEKSRTVKRNEIVKPPGTVDTDIYLIESGSLKIFVTDDSEERIIRFGYAGNIIVSLDSYLSGQPSELCIQAIKKTELKIASKSAFNAFINEDEKRMQVWIFILEDLILQQTEREIDLLTNSPKERFERVLKRSPNLFQEIPDKYIANYLRMSPETLSRLKKS